MSDPIDETIVSPAPSRGKFPPVALRPAPAVRSRSAMAATRVIVGIDEAGYGPTLGPLVVAGTAFEVPDGVGDLWRALAPAVSRKPGHAIPVDDSKALYPSSHGLRNLEEGVLPFLALGGEIPGTLADLLGRVSPPARHLAEYPWYRDRSVAIPRNTYATHVRALASRLADALARRRGTRPPSRSAASPPSSSAPGGSSRTRGSRSTSTGRVGASGTAAVSTAPSARST